MSTIKVRRLSRRKWKIMMNDLQGHALRANQTDGLSGREYQAKIEEVDSRLRALLNVIGHRGKKYPPRFPRTLG